MTNIESGRNQTKIEELESLRGLAALLVVLFHIPRWNELCDVGIINNGYLMVDLFFVLSGFVIHNTYSNKILSTRDLLRFQFLRFGRLYPVHLTFLLVYVIIEFAKYLAQIKLGITSPNSVPFKENNLVAFLQNVFLIQSILPNNASTFNLPAWSISVEFYTYLVFGLILLFANQVKIYAFCFLVITSLVMIATGATFGFGYFLSGLTGFFIGCLTSHIIKSTKIIVPNYFSIIILFSIILFLQNKTTKDFDIAIYFLTATLIFSLLRSNSGLVNRVLKLNILTWLGTISYSVYMSHGAIIWVVIQVFRVLIRVPEVGVPGKSTPQLSTGQALVAYLVIILSVLAISQIMYSFVEKPFREKSRRLALSKA